MIDLKARLAKTQAKMDELKAKIDDAAETAKTAFQMKKEEIQADLAELDAAIDELDVQIRADVQSDIDDFNAAANEFDEAIQAQIDDDTIFALDEGAVVCNTGILGKIYEWDGFDPIKDIPNGVYLTGFFSNYPTQKMIQYIFSFMDEHDLKPLIGATYHFEDIKEACIALDSGKVNGKIVVEV